MANSSSYSKGAELYATGKVLDMDVKNMGAFDEIVASVKGSGSVSASGVGYNFLLGTEYHVSDLIGIGANIGYVSGSLPEDKFGNSNDEDGSTGIFRLHFNVGLRFHF